MYVGWLKYYFLLFFFPSLSTGTSCMDSAKRKLKLRENGTDSPKRIKQSDNGISTIEWEGEKHTHKTVKICCF